MQDQCHIFQQRLIELEALLEGRETELEAVIRRLESAEGACNEGNMEIVQLRADLKGAQEQKDSMDTKVM